VGGVILNSFQDHWGTTIEGTRLAQVSIFVNSGLLQIKEREGVSGQPRSSFF
jgi:hypothetical protein